jgi:SAM-dependent methyltransferase
MSNKENLKSYFAEKLEKHGASPMGVDYNSVEAQIQRFEVLSRIFSDKSEFSLLDFGSGFGSMYDFLVGRGHRLEYFGYDISEPMVEKGREIHRGDDNCKFSSDYDEIPVVDFAVLSGTLNIRLDMANSEWRKQVLEILHMMDKKTRFGFSFNMLTMYSDKEKMKDYLYYGDPGFYFDYCKKEFSRNVALLHDYDLYDYTILVRKIPS